MNDEPEPTSADTARLPAHHGRLWGGPPRPADVGRFRTPPREKRDVLFTWGGDVAGQGYGINPEWGGYRLFKAMHDLRPDFFVHSGDHIYADNPLQKEVKLDDGTIWKNVVTEAK